MSEQESVRLDKWLWAARFFKTRALATTAIKNGQVECNGSRPKPSRMIKVGDQLKIQRQEELFELEVLVCAEKRASAKLAADFYQESEASQTARTELAAQRRAERLSAPMAPQRRPDKHARERIRRLIGK